MTSVTTQRPAGQLRHARGAEAPGPAVPAQRPAERLGALPSRRPRSWEGYRNAGPDVYWSPSESTPS